VQEKNDNLYLETGLSQIETTEILVEKLEPLIKYITYNIKRYKTPVSMLLFYTDEDISKKLHEYMRLTDVIKTIKIGESYFNFVFLLFTDNEGSYEFLKNLEISKLSKVDNYFYYEELEPEIYNIYNLLNSYLFNIAKKESFF